MKIIVVATDEEYKLAKKRFKRNIIIKTGVGGVNVYNKLKWIPKWIKILNFGYAGSNNIPIGTEVKIAYCNLYHPTIDYDEETYKLENGYINKNDRIICYTSNDFILKTNIKYPCVFDMELAYICMMFKNVESVKIVSDNLSLKQYEENIK